MGTYRDSERGAAISVEIGVSVEYVDRQCVVCCMRSIAGGLQWGGVFGDGGRPSGSCEVVQKSARALEQSGRRGIYGGKGRSNSYAAAAVICS